MQDFIVDLFARLAAIGADGDGGFTRPSYGPGEHAAHDLMAATARGLGLEVATDAAGNTYMTLPGRDRAAPRTVLGSHLDTVPRGGNYDGAAGVVAGLAMAAHLRDRGAVPAADLTVMGIRAEESVWFPASYIGSRAALGRLAPAELEIRRSDTGRTLADHMAEAGCDPAALAAGQRYLDPASVAAYVEIHIEQGPVLAAEGLPVGVVTAIRGGLRHHRAAILGEWAHSGATPRALRRDAVFAFADLLAELEAAWDRMEGAGRDLVLTLGKASTDPAAHAFSKVPGRLDFCLDARSTEDAALDAMGAEIEAVARSVAAARGVGIDLGPRSRSKPATMDPALVAALAAAAGRLQIPHRTLPSGAGHDAAAFAQAGVPSAMVFVRNDHGSHNPAEAMDPADLAAAARVALAALVPGSA
ncbi:MAG: Zn-dependent hydrolase [Hyphomicrobiales bacterium]|nr:Zn-dependent hydrolase [Hyphomicrobiales bacterium]MCP5371337.1 Zn-dependent hydrolase [Hyphomicrobiales bacterium]